MDEHSAGRRVSDRGDDRADPDSMFIEIEPVDLLAALRRAVDRANLRLHRLVATGAERQVAVFDYVMLAERVAVPGVGDLVSCAHVDHGPDAMLDQRRAPG